MSIEVCNRCQEECEIDDMVRIGKTQRWICLLCQEVEENRRAWRKLNQIDSENQCQEQPAKHTALEAELLAALKGLVKEIPLRGLNIRKDFSLINAHAAATKAIAKATEEVLNG